MTFHQFAIKPHPPEKPIESSLSTTLFLPIPIMVQDGRIVADSCASSLKACVPDDFLNLCMLLKIAATLPVTSCECERSINTMRRLNNYIRCTMGETRLSALALMHIKYDMPVNLDEIVNLFLGLHPRMMQFTSLVYDYQQIE